MTKNNIAFLRRGQNLTQKRLAEIIGMPAPTLNRIETGETQGFEKYRAKLAKALRCKPEDLDDVEEELAMIPVTGIIRHKTFIQKIEPSKAERVELIPGLPADSEAIKIMTKELPHYHRRNDLLFISSKPQTNEKQYLERECVVHLADKSRGDWLLAWVSKASTKGFYHLHVYNGPMITDVKIKAVYPVLFVKRT